VKSRTGSTGRLRQVALDQRVDREVADGAHLQGVAIGCGLGQQLIRQVAGPAGAVVGDQGLAQLGRHAGDEDAGGGIRPAGGDGRDDDAERAAGEGLRPRQGRRGQGGKQHGTAGEHGFPPVSGAEG
jgi:hypothetical protein